MRVKQLQLCWLVGWLCGFIHGGGSRGRQQGEGAREQITVVVQYRGKRGDNYMNLCKACVCQRQCAHVGSELVSYLCALLPAL